MTEEAVVDINLKNAAGKEIIDTSPGKLNRLVITGEGYISFSNQILFRFNFDKAPGHYRTFCLRNGDLGFPPSHPLPEIRTESCFIGEASPNSGSHAADYIFKFEISLQSGVPRPGFSTACFVFANQALVTFDSKFAWLYPDPIHHAEIVFVGPAAAESKKRSHFRIDWQDSRP